jgi:hypothetical protein
VVTSLNGLVFPSLKAKTEGGAKKKPSV